MTSGGIKADTLIAIPLFDPAFDANDMASQNTLQVSSNSYGNIRGLFHISKVLEQSRFDQERLH